jgi:hypothetical protein
MCSNNSLITDNTNAPWFICRPEVWEYLIVHKLSSLLFLARSHLNTCSMSRVALVSLAVLFVVLICNFNGFNARSNYGLLSWEVVNSRFSNGSIHNRWNIDCFRILNWSWIGHNLEFSPSRFATDSLIRLVRDGYLHNRKIHCRNWFACLSKLCLVLTCRGDWMYCTTLCENLEQGGGGCISMECIGASVSGHLIL